MYPINYSRRNVELIQTGGRRERTINKETSSINTKKPLSLNRRGAIKLVNLIG
jgi:hypothetical protein